ncbi:Fc receptor-like protein 4 [Mirounga leonina]|uniref:Fc receptor-like protein 4 n=1 Tax=Mirounga leonina TaxID=9715 RepID=UPI00156BF62F|nr:Fc receptor-like protein 4 [Mirounga leonina]
MLPWASLLFLAAVDGQLAAAPKPVISLHPPWITFFKGEAVTLTCIAPRVHAAGNIKWYRWYLGTEMLCETPGNTLEARVSGRYKCQTQDSPLSDDVSLIFSSGSLILQAPHSVFEGDTLLLRCQVKGREKLGTVKYCWNGQVISTSDKGQDLLIPQASLNNSGHYQCIGFLERNQHTYRSNKRIIKIQELFPRPKLEVTPPQPTEGGSANLSCQTRLPLERPDALLSFIFFRDHGVMLSNWSRSPELQITAIWREDSGSYWCAAAAGVPSICKHSLPMQVHVQGVPVSAVLLETQPQGGQVLAGERLVLVCSVAEGTGDTTFFWHREDTGESVGSKRQRSRRAELEIPAVGESHAGGYYCVADNGHGLARSGALNVTVTGEIESPWTLFVLSALRLGVDMASPPGDCPLSGSIRPPSVAIRSFLTQILILRLRSGLVAVGATGGLLSILLLAVALWICHQHQWKSGDGFLGNTARSPPAPGQGKSPRAGCPAPVELQRLYDNGHPGEGGLVYSEIQIIQLGQEAAASTSRTSLEDKHSSVVYSAVKTQLPEDSAGEVRSQDEDAVESYENVQFA